MLDISEILDIMYSQGKISNVEFWEASSPFGDILESATGGFSSSSYKYITDRHPYFYTFANSIKSNMLYAFDDLNNQNVSFYTFNYQNTHEDWGEAPPLVPFAQIDYDGRVKAASSNNAFRLCKFLEMNDDQFYYDESCDKTIYAKLSDDIMDEMFLKTNNLGNSAKKTASLGLISDLRILILSGDKSSKILDLIDKIEAELSGVK